jgi:glycosyltransferase involved in cell wall biosynthesis
VVRESDSGRVAAAGDIPALARAVRDWNTDRASLARIGSNGLQTVRQFDRKVVLQMFLDRILATRR